MDENIVELLKITIPILGTLLGTSLGIYYTGKNQLDLFNSEMKFQKRREKRERIEKTMKVYSEIIKSDGEEIIVTRVGGHVTDFDFEKYNEVIRPVIFDGYIYIHSNIAKIVGDLDSRIAECNFNEEALAEDHLYLCSKYFELTSAINSHLEEFRKVL